MNLIDSPVGIFSCWVNIKGSNSSVCTLFDSDIMSAWTVNGTNNGGVQFFLGDLDVEIQESAVLFTGTAVTEGWNHILFSWDFSGVAFQGNIYVNDLLYNNFVTGTYTPQNIRWSLMRYMDIMSPMTSPFGGSFSNRMFGCVAQFYLNTQEYLDFSVVTNRRKFYDPSTGPIDLGDNGQLPTGNAPSFYFTGGINDFTINQGTFDIAFPVNSIPTCTDFPPEAVVVSDSVNLLGFLNSTDKVDLLWTIPLNFSSGGRPVTHFNIYEDVGNVTPTTLVLTVTVHVFGITGRLVNPTTRVTQGYSYAITCINPAGESAYSNIVFLQG
jgi:hypothetical protein